MAATYYLAATINHAHRILLQGSYSCSSVPRVCPFARVRRFCRSHPTKRKRKKAETARRPLRRRRCQRLCHSYAGYKPMANPMAMAMTTRTKTKTKTGNGNTGTHTQAPPPPLNPKVTLKLNSPINHTITPIANRSTSQRELRAQGPTTNDTQPQRPRPTTPPNHKQATSHKRALWPVACGTPGQALPARAPRAPVRRGAGHARTYPGASRAPVCAAISYIPPPPSSTPHRCCGCGLGEV